MTATTPESPETEPSSVVSDEMIAALAIWAGEWRAAFGSPDLTQELIEQLHGRRVVVTTDIDKPTVQVRPLYVVGSSKMKLGVEDIEDTYVERFSLVITEGAEVILRPGMVLEWVGDDRVLTQLTLHPFPAPAKKPAGKKAASKKKVPAKKAAAKKR